ncbi:unnamed protein product [Calicophoron daubneyi]|uniref:Uncharacterized protein n=1 Tax=Calicophoron daubneyi TaxID=300641 RepID=A0AAV2TMU5_CALDB
MRPLSSLTTLLIQQNGVVELGALSQYFPKIETLDISCNQLTDFSNFLAELKHCELLREVNFEGNPWSHGPSGEASDFEELVKSQLPQVLIFKTKKRGESTPVVVEGSARDGGHQLYELIERQLTSMKESTAPIERCLNESYSAIQNMLEKLKDVGPDGEDKLKSDGQGSSRCGVRTKLTEALEYASSKGQAIEEHNKI